MRLSISPTDLFDSGHAKVSDATVEPLIHQHVPGGDVAMDDVLGMQMADPVGGVAEHPNLGLPIDGSSLLDQKVKQGAVGAILRDQAQVGELRAAADQPDDAGMVGDPGQQRTLLQEAGGQLGVVVVAMHQLDRHLHSSPQRREHHTSRPSSQRVVPVDLQFSNGNRRKRQSTGH